jgi:hypothetical protein
LSIVNWSSVNSRPIWIDSDHWTSALVIVLIVIMSGRILNLPSVSWEDFTTLQLLWTCAGDNLVMNDSLIVLISSWHSHLNIVDP